MSGAGRHLRAAVFSLAALVLGMVGHATAAHAVCAADLRACALAGPLVGGVGWLLAGGERGYVTLLVGTYAVQALLHVVMNGPTPPGAAMVTAHALAGAVAALGLRHGERTITRAGMLRAAGTSVTCTLAALVGLVAALPVIPAGPPARFIAWRTPWRPRSCWTVATAITRGPPLPAR